MFFSLTFTLAFAVFSSLLGPVEDNANIMSVGTSASKLIEPLENKLESEARTPARAHIVSALWDYQYYRHVAEKWPRTSTTRT
jgi:hypothetical protein